MKSRFDAPTTCLGMSEVTQYQGFKTTASSTEQEDILEEMHEVQLCYGMLAYTTDMPIDVAVLALGLPPC